MSSPQVQHERRFARDLVGDVIVIPLDGIYPLSQKLCNIRVTAPPCIERVWLACGDPDLYEAKVVANDSLEDMEQKSLWEFDFTKDNAVRLPQFHRLEVHCVFKAGHTCWGEGFCGAKHAYADFDYFYAAEQDPMEVTALWSRPLLSPKLARQLISSKRSGHFTDPERFPQLLMWMQGLLGRVVHAGGLQATVGVVRDEEWKTQMRTALSTEVPSSAFVYTYPRCIENRKCLGDHRVENLDCLDPVSCAKHA